MTEEHKIKIQWYRSCIATNKNHKLIVKSLGFKKLQQVIEHKDNPCVRGAVQKVPHLLRVIG